MTLLKICLTYAYITKIDIYVLVENMKKNNLDKINKEIGKKYNYIEVISYDNNLKKYNCKCECGKILLKRKFELKHMISCNCKKSKDLTNKRNKKLLYVSKEDNKWKCVCDCGNIVYHYAKDFNKVQSCGCLIKEIAKINIEKAINKNLLKTDRLAHIRKQFKKIYNDGDITFENFLELSQKDCYYCGSKPSNYKKSQAIREEFKIDFYYNGLDRLDNNLKHTKDNVVTCCKICNAGKSDMNYFDFLNLVKNIKINNKQYYKIINLTKEDYKLYKHYKENYIDGLKFEEFITLSKLDCFYCGCKPYNTRFNLNWNGIDRINNNLDHNINNCVPCCKNCNRFKRDLDINKFYDHINKIKINLGL